MDKFPYLDAIFEGEQFCGCAVVTIVFSAEANAGGMRPHTGIEVHDDDRVVDGQHGSGNGGFKLVLPAADHIAIPAHHGVESNLPDVGGIVLLCLSNPCVGCGVGLASDKPRSRRSGSGVCL
jgi:hypothetical protein